MAAKPKGWYTVPCEACKAEVGDKCVALPDPTRKGKGVNIGDPIDTVHVVRHALALR